MKSKKINKYANGKHEKRAKFLLMLIQSIRTTKTIIIAGFAFFYQWQIYAGTLLSQRKDFNFLSLTTNIVISSPVPVFSSVSFINNTIIEEKKYKCQGITTISFFLFSLMSPVVVVFNFFPIAEFLSLLNSAQWHTRIQVISNRPIEDQMIESFVREIFVVLRTHYISL